MSPGSPPAAKRAKIVSYSETLKDLRKENGSPISFKFNKKRVRVLSNSDEVFEHARGIAYWMSRDQRVQDNWAMLYAQKLAIKNKIPLHIVFCLMPKFLDATWRHYHFLVNGLMLVEEECKALGICFHLLLGQAATVLPTFVRERSIGALISDFSPLRGARQATDAVTAALPNTVPHCQVDAHNLVPCWVASNKLEYAARTIRRKINDRLPEFLTEFPAVVKHPFPPKKLSEPVDWEQAVQSLEVDQTVEPVKWAKPGTQAGLAILDSFCNSRLGIFAEKRNDPTVNALSNLSPWLHFGQISAQRAALGANSFKTRQNSPSVEAFCEELIVRRELSDNFCLYNENYDSVQGTNAWARDSLNLHRTDAREYLYTMPEWEGALTHDPLWNAAQLQLVNDGKMHGFLRMYWAKKILEWSASPESALATAIYLNDRFSLDGRDPNGFVGCMWSICGIHDQGWAERAIFGKIRFMNFNGCKRKFDVNAFIARYGGKKHPKKRNIEALVTSKEPEEDVPKTTVPKTTVTKTAVAKKVVSKTTVTETTVPKTAVPKTAVPKMAVPKTTVPKTAVPKKVVPRKAAPRTTVPKNAVPKKTSSPKKASPK